MSFGNEIPPFINSLAYPQVGVVVRLADVIYHKVKAIRGEWILTLFNYSPPRMFVEGRTGWKEIKTYDLPKDFREGLSPKVIQLLATATFSTSYLDNGDNKVYLHVGLVAPKL